MSAHVARGLGDGRLFMVCEGEGITVVRVGWIGGGAVVCASIVRYTSGSDVRMGNWGCDDIGRSLWCTLVLRRVRRRISCANRD